MVEKKFCDICGKEIDEVLDRVGVISYGFKAKGLSILTSSQIKKGETCESCIKALDAFIKTLKVKA